MNKKHILIFCTAILLLVIITACSSDNEKLKTELQEAISKQSEIKNHSFSGSVDMKLDMPLADEEQNPLTAGFIAMLSNSQITWQGVTNTETSQLELDLTIIPHNAAASVTLPVIMKDNKMYFNIPFLNINSEEYLTIDLSHMNSELRGTLFSSIFTHITEGIEAKWYNETTNDNAGKTIVIEITEDNYLDILKSLWSKFPLIVNDLESSGLLTEQQADNIRNLSSDELNETLKNLEIDKPGLLSFTINQDGYITEQKMNLYFSAQSIELNYKIEDINQGPEFQKEIPKNTRSFDDIIKQMSGATQ